MSRNDYHKEWSAKNAEHLKEYKRQYFQKNKERLLILSKKWKNDNAEHYSKKNKEYSIKNSSKIKEYGKQKNIRDRDKLSMYRVEYGKNNRVKISAHYLEYKTNRRNTDALFRLKDNLRARMGVYFRSIKKSKPCKSIELLGADWEIIKLHIEKQFCIGMNWSNHGKGIGKWNIDHKIPLASAKTVEEVIPLFHYTNLQPLWEEDNLRKGAKILPVQMKIAI